MRTASDHGRVYRRCGCRNQQHRQLGAHCPQLATDPGHGTWTFAVDLPSPAPGRHTIRRGGYSTEESARTALRRLLEGHNSGFSADPNQTVGDYLNAWLKAKDLALKPTTMARYRTYVTQDLIPALGEMPLDDLGYPHVAGLVHAELARGRGRVTVHRILATLSSALGDAVRHHRLPANPARPTIIPRPAAAERRIWTVQEASRFLRHCHAAEPLFADLVEVLIGTGMRKGEALALHWNDVHFNQQALFVRYTLSAIDNNRLVLTTPKTRSSRNWVALSPRVATALRNRAQDAPTLSRPDHSGYVFHRPDGRPLHPEYVLNHFHYLCKEAGVPRTGIHDLRHLTATIAITAGVPLTVVSKTLRHSTLSTTANIYSHLTAQAAREAVTTIDTTLTRSDDSTATPTLIAGPRPRGDHNPKLRNCLALANQPRPNPSCPTHFEKGAKSRDHNATTTATNTEKAVSASLRKRPPTCENAGRDDRI
ncbi:MULTISPECIES: tyrosine-type recombinase/integrase [Streptomyces]|uniref:tyrosine-type recombinase/integrase n=1 Tax=Streptomyces TaxID=1883 RepID=UPI0018DF1DEB|nr:MULTISPECIES: site-specific integrase [Streptomyces]MCZ4102455.1 tyrosine-type recombinase/integrase [Streptomyces sp. H39-C1]